MEQRVIKKYAPWLLLVLGLATHFIGLQHPAQVIFDEVHFGKFTTSYCCTGSNIFDIHPPHAKLLIAGTAYVFGYRGGFDFDHIGEPFGSVPVVALRIFPAITGVLLPLLLYRLLKQLNVSTEGALLGGLLFVFDNALTIQTRVIALDGLLLLATFASISAWLTMQSKTGAARYWWAVVTGIAVALSVGSKFTGLMALMLVVLMSVVVILRDKQRATIQRELSSLLVIGLVAVVVYGAGWALHFALLPNPGSGDVWGRPVWTGNVVSDFISNTVTLHQKMLSANYNLKAAHPDASPWWSWPMMLNPVYYWYGGPQTAVYFIGNPVVWWGGTLLFIVAALSWCFELPRPLRDNRWILIGGFGIALAPLMGIPRALFMYHYLTPLIFSLLTGIWWLDQSVKEAKRSVIYSGIIVVVIIGFVFMSPVTYGFTPPPWWYQALSTVLR